MNKKEIIERLKTNKSKSNQFSFFGDDCHKNIDEMIEVLEKDLTPTEAEEHFGCDILDIFEVLSGEIDIEDILYPEV